jgi:hypothetical protein
VPGAAVLYLLQKGQSCQAPLVHYRRAIHSSFSAQDIIFDPDADAGESLQRFPD